jgi:hypothetical protein
MMRYTESHPFTAGVLNDGSMDASVRGTAPHVKHRQAFNQSSVGDFRTFEAGVGEGRRRVRRTRLGQVVR